MIICNGCGKPNDDIARSCAFCGRKLQSRRQPAFFEPAPEMLRRMDMGAGARGMRGEFLRMLEAWGVALVNLAVVGFCLWKRVIWPAYPALVLSALWVWLRKL